MKAKTLITLVLVVLFLAGCAEPGLMATPTTNPTTAPTATPQPALPASPEPTHIAVDLTPAQMAAEKALSEKYNVPIDQIKLVSTEEVTWSDGCLGVVLPGMMCTQAQVPGFRILLEANGQQYEFHTNQDGRVVVDAARQLALLKLVVTTADQSIALVDPKLALGPTYNPAFTGFLPAGAAKGNTAYVLDFTNQAKAKAVSDSGNQDLAFIQNPNYGLALWRGGPNTQPRLAWGTQPDSQNGSSTLMVSNLDGSDLQTLQTLTPSGTPSQQLVAELWSADGQALYFSKEPVGIGGYIPFSGASSLYRIDRASKQVSELIPAGGPNGAMVCLDAISADFQHVADHCTQNVITVRDLSGGANTTVNPPEGLQGFRLLGSARFSPDGQRVAFALAKGDATAEQGWAAVSDGLSGASKLVMTGQAGGHLTVIGWLNDSTLLVQFIGHSCNPTCASSLWTVGADGSNPTQVGEGSFLTIIDNR